MSAARNGQASFGKAGPRSMSRAPGSAGYSCDRCQERGVGTGNAMPFGTVISRGLRDLGMGNLFLFGTFRIGRDLAAHRSLPQWRTALTNAKE